MFTLLLTIAPFCTCGVRSLTALAIFTFSLTFTHSKAMKFGGCSPPWTWDLWITECNASACRYPPKWTSSSWAGATSIDGQMTDEPLTIILGLEMSWWCKACQLKALPFVCQYGEHNSLPQQLGSCVAPLQGSVVPQNDPWQHYGEVTEMVPLSRFRIARGGGDKGSGPGPVLLLPTIGQRRGVPQHVLLNMMTLSK